MELKERIPIIVTSIVFIICCIMLILYYADGYVLNLGWLVTVWIFGVIGLVGTVIFGIAEYQLYKMRKQSV